MAVETSIIIRTKNEERYIEEILAILKQQTYQNFEVIIVDSGSKDGTLEKVKKFNVKLLEIPPEDFSYPYALNYGIAHATATKYVCILSAHSIPISDRWLEAGIKDFLLFENVAGVYGHLRALPNGTFWDKVFTGNYTVFFRKLKRRAVGQGGMGVLGFTNAIIRKDLWDKKHLNEKYAGGGEDGEWAGYWLEKGYKIIFDPAFAVCHSHHLGLWGWYKQLKHWKSTSKPQPFTPLSFRKDGAHTNK